MLLRPLVAFALLAAFAAPALGQFGAKEEGSGPRLGKTVTHEWKTGITVTALGGGGVANCYGTIPVPTDWPEQQVKVVKEDISPTARGVTYRVVDNSIRQMVFEIPQIPAGATGQALITFEVTKAALLPPSDPSALAIPKNAPREVRKMLGSSPFIESTNARIRSLAKELTAGKEGAWEQLEAIYDGVRDKVKVEAVGQAGAATALREGKGTKEDLTALFVACCRAHKVPARMVWVVDGCYAEFYLQDKDNKGYWIPASLIPKDKQFGQVSDTNPIMQKGDNIKVPENKEAYRFVPEFFKASGIAGGRPRPVFVRQLMPAN
ncbi:MAG TPA: transglutaminase-like domain-containing protein [Pirellulaceae bacterium]|nr:transglutaminase-like domain-containing protein [Pirellulaceae bacterium]